MRKFHVLFLLYFSCNTLLQAQIDTVNAMSHNLLLQNLKEGTNTYLVYSTDSTMQRRTIGDLWVRKTSFIKLNNNDLVRFDWKVVHYDSVLATIVNFCDRKTLAPVYNRSDIKKRGTFAYNYTATAMIPADSVVDNNAMKKGPVTLSIPIISWELDMETYPLLPIKKVGQIFDIAFFDPNEKEAAYHRYTVVGKESLSLNADTKENCWLLRIDYAEKTHAIFWLTEKSKELIKVREYYNENYIFKVKQY